MKSPDKVPKKILKYIKELRDDSELHERRAGFDNDLKDRTETYNMINNTIHSFEEKNRRLAAFVIFIDVKEELPLIKELQQNAYDTESKIKKHRESLPIVAEQIANAKHLVKLYEIGAERKMWAVWELECACGITEMSWDKWKFCLDMEHYDRTGVMKNKRIKP